MCTMCLQTPCDLRCPNAEDQKPILICDNCKEGIYEGDRYAETPEGYICECCLDNMSVSEILEIFNTSLEEAM